MMIVHEDSSEDDISLTPTEISEQAKSAIDNLLPAKSRKIYEKSCEEFMEWRSRNNVNSFSENVIIVYFEEISNTKKPSTLWSSYSMLKATLSLKNEVDISQYHKLGSLLKRKSEGYTWKKAKTFTNDEIKLFIDEAPDEVFLLIKVCLIFGIMGACRRQELHQLKFEDIKDLGSFILVNLINTKTKKPRSFTVPGKYYSICKKYLSLRPKSFKNRFFFLNYQNGKCTSQNIGINKIGNMGKQVATYLKLPNAELYTGHSFRRSSATLLVDGGGDLLSLKRHGGWKSSAVAEGYIDESIQNKIDVSNKLLNSVEHNNSCLNINAESSSTKIDGGFFPVVNFNNCTINNLFMGPK